MNDTHKLYLRLYDGQHYPDRYMASTGWDGPFIGPITHVTLEQRIIMHIHFSNIEEAEHWKGFTGWEAAFGGMSSLLIPNTDKGLIPLGSAFYRHCTVTMEPPIRAETHNKSILINRLTGKR